MAESRVFLIRFGSSGIWNSTASLDTQRYTKKKLFQFICKRFEETLTVIFEAMLLSMLVAFPSMSDLDGFPLLRVLFYLLFCVLLSYPTPLPLIFGFVSATVYALSALYGHSDLKRDFSDDLQFSLTLHKSM